MKKLWIEFKEFINRGNVMDLAVAVVMGAAFTAIINAIIGDFVTPFLSIITFGIDFSSLSFVLGEGENAAEFRYGSLIESTLNFVATAIVIFFIIKAVNKIARKKVLAKVIPTKDCPYCSSHIPKTAARCPNCTTVLDAKKVPDDLR